MMKLLHRFCLCTLMVLLFGTACTKVPTTQNQSLGLSRFASDQVEIWLPDDFYLVDPEHDIKALRQFLATIDPANSAYWSQPANERLKPIIELEAVRNSSQYPYRDTVTIYALYHSIPLSPPPSPVDVVQGLRYDLPDSFQTSRYEELFLPAGKAAHTSIESQIAQFPVSSDVYSLTSAGSLWLITFAGNSETFDAEIHNYRAWIETFQVIRNPSVADYYRHNAQVFHCFGSMLLFLLIIVIAIKVRSSRGPIYEPS